MSQKFTIKVVKWDKKYVELRPLTIRNFSVNTLYNKKMWTGINSLFLAFSFPTFSSPKPEQQEREIYNLEWGYVCLSGNDHELNPGVFSALEPFLGKTRNTRPRIRDFYFELRSFVISFFDECNKKKSGFVRVDELRKFLQI